MSQAFQVTYQNIYALECAFHKINKRGHELTAILTSIKRSTVFVIKHIFESDITIHLITEFFQLLSNNLGVKSLGQRCRGSSHSAHVEERETTMWSAFILKCFHLINIQTVFCKYFCYAVNNARIVCPMKFKLTGIY